MWNPFKQDEQKQAEVQRKEEADYQMAQTVVGSPAPQFDEQAAQERKDILVQLSQWQQDRSPAMKKIFLKMAAYEIRDEKLIKVKWDEGYCSLMGSAKLVGYIESLDHNVMLANWDQANVIKTMRDSIAHPMRRFIFQNHNELDISIEHAEYLFWIIINTIEPNYWRGWNDGERRKDKEIIKVSEIRHPYFQPKKRAIFGVEA